MNQPVKNKRQLQAEQTKDRLFYAARDLLTERDFDDITIRDIVARAQVSIGTFYHYYTTKMDVFYETYRLADHYFTQTVAPLMIRNSVYENVLLFFNCYVTYNADLTDRKMLRLLYNPSNTYFNRDPHQGMQGVLFHLVEQGLANGELTGTDKAEDVVHYLMVASRGLVYHWCTTDYAYDLHAEMDKFVRLLLKAYLPA